MKLPRSKALVVAGVAGLTTLVLGSAVLVLGAASGSSTVLSTDASTTEAATVVSQVQYDDTYAIVGEVGSGSSGAVQAASVAAAPPGSAVEAPATTTTARSDPPATEPAPNPEPKPETTTTTTTPTTPTTLVVLYPKDLPPGWEIPENWPQNKALPPIPPGCVLGHLEDNGHWNCEH